jgi:nicotinamide phosphoribosyltransferase
MYSFIPFIFLLDGYKTDHRRQYPDFLEYVFSNYTCRGSRLANQNYSIFFGLQYILKHYFGTVAQETFFNRDVDEVCAEYQQMLDNYFGPNDIGTDHIRALHQLGYIPLEFHAVPEGTRVPLNMPSFTVINTHKDFGWLTNYFETLLACLTWMPINSATVADRFRKILDETVTAQGGDVEFVNWQAHDFSFRGMAGVEAALLSGAAHLLHFTGTDTIPAIKFLETFYYAEGFVGGSVPATEHSVMCAGGEVNERETFKRLLNLYPRGILSVVSDTWDLWHVITNILTELRDDIMSRDGKLVIRPDSGDPVKIICGNDAAEPGHPATKGVVELLWDIFGGTYTPEGYKVLDPHIGVIYGDSINEERLLAIRDGLATKGFALANMVFGVGSFTYQYNTRDTLGQAMKATWAQVDGVEHMLQKDPVTDTGLKKSATGMIQLFADQDGSIRMVQNLDLFNWRASQFEPNALLRPVWRNGEFLVEHTLEEIRARVSHAQVNLV